MHVELREGESQESLLSRFTKMIQRSGIMREVKAHRFFVSKSERARAAERKAVRRQARRQARLDGIASRPRRPRPKRT